MTPAATSSVAHMTWDVVGQRMEAGAVALLPAGAGAKQHGLHLPMMTDQLLAEYFTAALATRLQQRTDALIWPTLTYGYYPAFTAYCGSVSLAEAQFRDLTAIIVGGLLGYGARHVVIVDAGLSTRRPIESAIAANAWGETVTRLGVFEGSHMHDTAGRNKRQSYGSHADEIETSIMLALFPSRVAMARAAASPVLPGGPKPGPLEPADPLSANYAPSGSFGDPALATPELGRQLVAAILADLSEWTDTFDQRPACAGR